MKVSIVLASASPRRRELLDQINVSYRVLPISVDETPGSGELPTDYVCRLAAEKSAAGMAQQRLDGLPQADTLPVLAADTTVVLSQQIFGKPKNCDEAAAMLRQLSGRTHQVLSAVSLRGLQHGLALSVTEVTFRPLTTAEIVAYCQSGEPLDKAGSYAIQGLGSIFVASIRGSYSGVMGLPLFETAELLSRQGIHPF